MKVWMVEETDWFNTSFVGLYKTREAAIEAIRKDCDWQSFEVDDRSNGSAVVKATRQKFRETVETEYRVEEVEVKL